MTQDRYALAGGDPLSYLDWDGHDLTPDGGGGGAPSPSPSGSGGGVPASSQPSNPDSGIGGQLKEFGQGLWEGAVQNFVGLAQASQQTVECMPGMLGSDALSCGKDLYQTGKAIAEHPGDVLGNLIDYQDFSSGHTARGIGHELPTLAGSATTKGAGGDAEATTAVETGITPTTVGGLKYAGLTDAHLIIQHAAVRDVEGYSRLAAPGVQLPTGRSSSPVGGRSERRLGCSSARTCRRLLYGSTRSDVRFTVADPKKPRAAMTPIEICVRTILDLLVRGEYKAVENITQGFRMSADEIEEAITEYGRTLVAPDPEAWWALVDIIPVRSESGKVHVDAPLWTEEEGRSDLEVELWLTEFMPGLYRPALLNIHVP